MQDIDGILLDLSGVLYEGDRPIDGAVETVAALMRHYPVRFITNTTRSLPDDVAKKLEKMGFDIPRRSIFTALDATAAFLQEKNATGYFLVYKRVASYFDGWRSDRPDFVVVADAYTDFGYERLNEAFRHLMAGATLLAVAKNRYFKDHDGGLSLDAGGFVACLEYATAQEATILGKPSTDFFQMACASMGTAPQKTLMIGDDIESDIAGAQRAGLKACQVKTGKFRPEDLEGSVRPDCLLDSIADLPRRLGILS